MKQMTNASVREIGQYFGHEYASNVERSIAKLEEQRYKKDLLDLVVRELLEHAEMRLARERRRIRQTHRRAI
jgi:chromosomal replication initiation ATPase DnaA